MLNKDICDIFKTEVASFSALWPYLCQDKWSSVISHFASGQLIRQYFSYPLWKCKWRCLFSCVFSLKPSSLSTLSLQYDKRMQDESRGGKRKIRLVQEQVNSTFKWGRTHTSKPWHARGHSPPEMIWLVGTAHFLHALGRGVFDYSHTKMKHDLFPRARCCTVWKGASVTSFEYFKLLCARLIALLFVGECLKLFSWFLVEKTWLVDLAAFQLLFLRVWGLEVHLHLHRTLTVSTSHH